MNDYLTCECSICVSHRFEIKDRHTEIKWKLSKSQKLDELHAIMKAYNCDMERGKKIQQGEIK